MRSSRPSGCEPLRTHSSRHRARRRSRNGSSATASAAAPVGHRASATQPLEQIVVAASRYELTRTLSASPTSLSGTDIENLPDIGDDTLRALEWLPGAASNGITRAPACAAAKPARTSCASMDCASTRRFI